MTWLYLVDCDEAFGLYKASDSHADEGSFGAGWRAACRFLEERHPEANPSDIEVTSAMEEAGIAEARRQYNLPVTRASVYAIFNAMLRASLYVSPQSKE